MAAITPSNIYQESAGSLKRTIAKFGVSGSTVSSGDSWASGIQNIVYISGVNTSVLNTATNYAVACSWTASNGTIIIRTSLETSTSLYLNILSKNG